MSKQRKDRDERYIIWLVIIVGLLAIFVLTLTGNPRP